MDDNDMMFSQSFEREGSQTPPLFAYQTYPAPEELIYSYPQSQPYRGVVSTGAEYTDYLQPIPVTLPSMIHVQDAIKREGDDTMSPYNMYTHSLPGIDIHPHHYDDSNPHVSISPLC